MFEYKDNTFYDEYFSSLPDFKLTQKFQRKGDRNDEGLKYIGQMESVNAVHPISIQIEIPLNFPHGKMLFWTKSLVGYPHLIPFLGRDDYWFCLNTPFAETAEEQLNQEMSRLREWIKRYVRKDLPAIIKDSYVIQALNMANAYSWENPDEMNEYRKDARLTFIGDFATKAESFKEKKGKFHCVKNGSNRIFALQNAVGTNYELPYIIVNEGPNSYDIVHMREQYEWDDKTCKFLLPEINISNTWYESSIQPVNTESYTEEDACQILDSIEDELKKEESRIKSSCIFPDKELPGLANLNFRECLVPSSHKAILLNKVYSLKSDVKKQNGYKSEFKKLLFGDGDCDDYVASIEYTHKIHTFAIGVSHGNLIRWNVISISNAMKSWEYITQVSDLGFKPFVHKL